MDHPIRAHIAATCDGHAAQVLDWLTGLLLHEPAIPYGLGYQGSMVLTGRGPCGKTAFTKFLHCLFPGRILPARESAFMGPPQRGSRIVLHKLTQWLTDMNAFDATGAAPRLCVILFDDLSALSREDFRIVASLLRYSGLYGLFLGSRPLHDEDVGDDAFQVVCPRMTLSSLEQISLDHGSYYDALESSDAMVAFRAHLRARRRWLRVRAYWRARWIAVYWHARTARLMAPGGSTAKRDREEYEEGAPGVAA